ncbi:glycoside hydrolase family 16 protein [Desarmillaria tabescens]|uniref:Glycoside hydrolase family 16 protein n=1 Tax=Armillaria tabescens TaxID=1929756 RepID=A0AA39JT43_ARMTA|nr:glycoside hydrolase family 16 protein [Desarmillaria tabescens]KAK0446083.1 glycoside hydrolase family 16 protein [Desarmillaria tabescens]
MIWPRNSCLQLLILHVLFYYQLGSAYDIVRDYSGSTFFDRWDFLGTGIISRWRVQGDVWWLSKADAFAQGLAYVNNAGNAIIKVDNMHNVVYGQKRNSVRITSQDIYAVGSCGSSMSNISHLDVRFGPLFGPQAIKMNGPWEARLSGMFPKTYSIKVEQLLKRTVLSLLVVRFLELKENSLYTGLAEAGGGVWATQFDVSGIFIWFWSRPNVPASISATTASTGVDLSDWGPPSASYPATYCNIPEFFSAQNLVLDITLCGQWAGLSNLYFPSCGSGTGTCYADSVVGPGSTFNDAYFEISYIRAYTTGAPAPTPNALEMIYDAYRQMYHFGSL